MAFIPDEIIDQILDRINVAEFIGEYISVKRAGRNFKALCPFHKEKTPSFMISPEKGIFHCFGCGAGGNALSFVMKYEGLEFPEAVKLLAEKTRITLPSYTPAQKEEESLASRLYGLNDIAANFYQDNLLKHPQGKPAYAYLLNRGLDENAIRVFRLGYAPNLWEALINFCRQKNIDLNLLEKAGLALPGKNETLYDRFRNRIVFPIFDIRQRILGFGARVLDESLPKYVNSPETLVYSKGRHLYGLNFSKEYIKKVKYAIIAEGYLDLIMPYKFGVRNVVATLGTALTVDQIRLLKRYADTAVIIYDSDRAGEEASLRGLDLMVAEDLDVRIATLPPGSDPDSFVRGYGKEAFYEIVKKSKNLFDYKLGQLTSRFNIDDLRSKAKIASIMLPTIARINNAVLKSGYLKRLAERLNVPEDSLREEMKKVKPDYTFYAAQNTDEHKTRKPFKPAEVMILSIAFNNPRTLNAITEKIKPDEFREPGTRQIFEKLFEFYKDKRAILPSHFLNLFEDENIKSIISEAVSIGHTIFNEEKVLEDCINRVKDDNLKEDLNKLHIEIKKAEAAKNNAEVQRLVSRYNTLLRNLNGIK